MTSQTTQKDASPFQDLDSVPSYEAILGDVLDYRTRNFAVRFDAAGAKCAVNVPKDGMQAASRMSEVSKGPSCRWLNIWSPSVDECSTVRGILTSYGVSRRLAHLLCPGTAKGTNVDSQRNDVKQEKVENAQTSDRGSQGSSQSSKVKQRVDQQQRDHSRKKKTAPSMDNITKDLWHFNSIDWGRRYACISYNALFTAEGVEENVLSRQPEALRIWSAIVLCDDGLVISIFETPKGLPPDQIKTIRKNQVNLLKNLSWQYDANNAEAGIFQVDVRPARADMDLPAFDHFAAASRLFYYLFDDWRATFELVSGRQHPYRQKLHEVRARMSKTPLVEDVEKLHQLGQQLVILQRVYQGYEKLVDRLLQRQRHVSMALWQSAQRRQTDLLSLSRHSTGGIEPGVSTTSLPAETPPWITETEADQKTIRLPLTTMARFERLLDRIRLYALIEIEECIAEKESLVLLVSPYFTRFRRCLSRLKNSSLTHLCVSDLQPRKPEECRSHRTPHSRHHSARQGHYIIPTGQFDDGVLRGFDGCNRPIVFARNLLGVLCRCRPTDDHTAVLLYHGQQQSNWPDWLSKLDQDADAGRQERRR